MTINLSITKEILDNCILKKTPRYWIVTKNFINITNFLVNNDIEIFKNQKECIDSIVIYDLEILRLPASEKDVLFSEYDKYSKMNFKAKIHSILGYEIMNYFCQK